MEAVPWASHWSTPASSRFTTRRTAISEPSHQPPLVALIEAEVAKGRVGVLFVVGSFAVPRSLTEFWLGVVQRLGPRGLCAMAIVSHSIAVRAAASGFRVMNSLRGAPVEVRTFKGGEDAAARSWLAQTVGVRPA